MLDDTWTQYLLIRIIISVLQHIGPLCCGYTAWNISNSWPERPAIGPLSIWCAIESLFFIFILFYREYLQRDAIHPAPRSKEERQALFAKVRSEVHDPEKFFGGWFRGAKVEDIGREDVRVFLNWAFWDGRADMAVGGADDEELDEYVGKVEKMMRTPFKPGRGNATSLRLTLDPIDMECRTVLWYGLIMLVDTITHNLMKRNGFQYFKTASTSLSVYPPRPLAIVEKARSPAKNISYWLRPHTSKTRLPILYIHGIGIGLLPSIRMFREITEAMGPDEKFDGQVGILAIEILEVSSRLYGTVLRRDEFLQQLTQILDSNGYDRFVLVSHSYGSVLSTHLLTHEPLAARTAATLMIDPVTVLLHMPDVAYNFTVRKPKHANEWLLWYFASKDPGVAHALGRHFFWSENVLWRDHIMKLVTSGMKVTASLASKDLIVDTQAVGTYLTEHENPDPNMEEDEAGRELMKLKSHDETYGTANEWKQRPWRGKGLEVVWWEGLDHAQVFDQHATRARLIEILVDYCTDR